MELLIPAAFGVEAVVRRQVEKLNFAPPKADFGRLLVSNASWLDVARLNTFLASGERVLIKLAEFNARSFDELYDTIRSLNLKEYIAPNARILISAKSVQSALGAIKALSSVCKKAIVDNLCAAYRLQSLAENGARVKIDLALRSDTATLSLDTSGEGLYKRGYRDLSIDAPLKETTAAALLDLSVYRADKQLADLFCGSGTIAIEAAMRELKIAPNAARDFDFMQWPCTPPNAIKNARQEAADIRRQVELNITAYDVDPNCIKIAKHHARRAGVENYIHFQQGDFSTFSSAKRYGVLISNPPYGERLLEDDRAEIERIYKGLGQLRKKLQDWSFFIFSAFDGVQKCIGRKADKNRKLYNANILCYYYSFLGAKPSKTRPSAPVFATTEE